MPALEEVLDEWRKACMHNSDTYHPVPITSSSCKMSEHIIANYTNDFHSENKVFLAYQHGFREGMSIATQLESTVHEFFSVVDMHG